MTFEVFKFQKSILWIKLLCTSTSSPSCMKKKLTPKVLWPGKLTQCALPMAAGPWELLRKMLTKYLFSKVREKKQKTKKKLKKQTKTPASAAERVWGNSREVKYLPTRVEVEKKEKEWEGRFRILHWDPFAKLKRKV